MTGNHWRRIKIESFWKSAKGKRLKKRLHATRNDKGRFTKKEETEK